MVSPPPPTTSMITVDAVSLAVDVIIKWVHNQSKHRKAQLLDEDDLLYLVLTVKRIPSSSRINPYRIPIPHPLHSLSTTSICLLLDDRPSSLSSSSARDIAISESLPVSEIIALSDLRTDYRPYESRRKLCDSHDLFFADRRIIPLLPRLIGKHFFKKKKLPLSVDFSRKGWPEQIRRCCNSTMLYLRSGTCSVIKVGRTSQPRDHIVDNVIAAVDGVIKHVPKKWANVRSLHIKSVESLALPVYQAVPELGLKIASKDDELYRELVQVEDKERKRKPLQPLKGSKKSKKGRIHEVPYMDMVVQYGSEDADADADEIAEEDELEVEKNDGENDAKLGKRKGKKGKIIGNGNDDEDLPKFVGGEDESGSGLGLKKSGNKTKQQKQEKMASDAIEGKKKKKKNGGIVRDDKQVHLDKVKGDSEDCVLNDGEVEKGSDKLSVKKRKKDKSGSGAVSNKLKEKDTKKTKRNKVKHETD